MPLMPSGDDAARWRRVQSLCELVEPLAFEERVSRLRELEADSSIRREVLELIDALANEHRHQRVHHIPAPRSRPDSLPTTIGGVRIEAYVGSGGSGDVYRGVRTTNGTDQMVAVKLFHTHRATSDDLMRFAREQQVLATLTHPSIVRFFDAGTTPDGRPYLVMELADGLSITEYCDDRALPIPARLRLFLRVCEAVESAHRSGILHLDLKPSNVIVAGDDPEAYIKLVDFGTAKLVDSAHEVTRTEPLTVQYASPERLRGETLSRSCDVYSLGLILFEVLSGGWPFRRPESVVAVAERAAGVACTYSLPQTVTSRAAEQRGVTVERLKETLNGGLHAIVSKATAHEPGQRYSAVVELMTDVRRYLDGDRLDGRRTQRESAMSVWMKRYPWRIAAAAMVVVLLAAAAVYSAADIRTVTDAGTGSDTAAAAATAAVQKIRQIPVGGEDAQTSMKYGDGLGPLVFDDFSFPQGAEITGVTWFGIYCARPLILKTPPAPTATAFGISFHADAGGQPEMTKSVYSEVLPISRVRQTMDSMRMAMCGGPEPTAYGYYHYTAALGAPFQAKAGTRYWMSVHAQVKDRPDANPVVYWGWVGATSGSKQSIQVARDGTSKSLPRDRVFTLIRKP